jgi:transaldolase
MVKIFLDGADAILENKDNSLIEGFTTNPTLLKKAGIVDYKSFALKVLDEIKIKPISFEVLTDDFSEMVKQAVEISSWGENVYVKIPITNTKGESAYHIIEELTLRGVKINVTAIMTVDQARQILPALSVTRGAYISVFAGRIADTGVNPVPTMVSVKNSIRGNIELIWASPREVFNVYQAEVAGCDIITCSQDLIKKLSLRGKDLVEFSRDTVKMFYEDGKGLIL